MKITTNAVGNYTNIISRNNIGTAKTQPAAAKAKIVDTAKAGGTEKLSADEKNFFVNMYPQNKKEIMDHHFYERNGRMSGVKVGSIINRRG
jgi:allantoicase